MKRSVFIPETVATDGARISTVEKSQSAEPVAAAVWHRRRMMAYVVSCY